MYYADMVEKLPHKIFSWQDVQRAWPNDNPKSISNSLARWVRNGSLIQLKKGVYKLHTSVIDYTNLACILYPVSYLSLETVLLRQKIIDQKFINNYCPKLKENIITAIHPSQSFHFAVCRGGATYNYSYSSIKPELFSGFHTVKCPLTMQEYQAAYPEKAILDFFYLRRPDPICLEEMNFPKPFYLKRYLRYLAAYPEWLGNLYSYL